MKKLFGILTTALLWILFPCTLTKAGELKEVFIEGVEDMSVEEASEYIGNYIGIEPFNLDELTGISSIAYNSKEFSVIITKKCNLGFAEEVGVKEVYIQHRKEGSNTFGSIMVWEACYTHNTNDLSHSVGYELKDPVIWKYYRGKQKHYIIYDGVEYSYYTYTAEIHFTGE